MFSTKEYGRCKVAHVYIVGNEVLMDIYTSMDKFIEGETITYNDKLGCYTMTPKNNDKIVITTHIVDTKDNFIKKAKAYGKRYGFHCYKAIYAEVLVANVLGGRHNKPNTPHGKGDVVTKYTRYEVKFGLCVTL